MEKNIIKKIPNIKSDRNLLIYDYHENIDFLKKYKLNKWLKYKLDHAMQIYKVYYGDIYNPPFFSNIICLKNNLSLEELQQLWNMTYLNGYILINHTKHDHLFKKSIIENNNNMILIKKKYFYHIFISKISNIRFYYSWYYERRYNCWYYKFF